MSPARALEVYEIENIVSDYVQAAQRAKDAGFDGVEVHAANGYLPDLFLQSGTNSRTDRYGGSVENRARFLIEVVEAISTVWGFDRIGIRLSPNSQFQEMSDADPHSLWSYVAKTLDRFHPSYLHVIEPRIAGNIEVGEQVPVASAELRKVFSGKIIAAGGFDGSSANRTIAMGDAVLVAFGRHFIANPDLPARLKNGWALNPYDRDSFYGGDQHGYIDYPFYNAPHSAAQPSQT